MKFLAGRYIVAVCMTIIAAKCSAAGKRWVLITDWRWKYSCWTNCCYLVTQFTVSPGKRDVTILMRECIRSAEPGHERFVSDLSSFISSSITLVIICSWMTGSYFLQIFYHINRYVTNIYWKWSCVCYQHTADEAKVMASLFPNVFTKT